MALILIVVSSCGGGVDTEDIEVTKKDTNTDVVASKEQISVSNRNISFLADGGSTDVTVNANCAWVIKADGDEVNWLTVNPTTGNGTATVTLRAAANTTTASRTVYLTIGGKLVSQSITVTQKAADQPAPSAKAPVIGSSSYRDVTTNGATVVLSATSEWAMTEYGVCYSPSNNQPGESDMVVKKTANTTSLENATLEITGLEQLTTYYARVYARSAAGTTFGSVLTFTTSSNVPGSGDNIPPTP